MPAKLDQFIDTIARLRAPDGCPWDREQSHATLARYLLEETYEVLEAIHLGQPAKFKEELGDLLLQIVLNAQIAKEADQFDIEDIAEAINAKMIKRHPHIFGQATAKTAKQVVVAWEEMKHEESKAQSGTKSALDGVPRTLPALMQALKISEKAVTQGFEWREEEDIWSQLHSELAELRQAIAAPDDAGKRRDVDLELGDVLFTLANIARWHSLNPEESLLLAIDKFKKRFQKMEELAQQPLKNLSFEQLAGLWKQAKESL